MVIRIGTEKDKEWILEKYPYTSAVIRQGGSLVVACEQEEIAGFSWSFRRDIPIAVGNVIKVFDEGHRCKGIASMIVQKCIEVARENGSYQVRAYCDANNIPSHMLWVKNGFSVSPVKMDNGQIVGSYVAYVL